MLAQQITRRTVVSTSTCQTIRTRIPQLDLVVLENSTVEVDGGIETRIAVYIHIAYTRLPAPLRIILHSKAHLRIIRLRVDNGRPIRIIARNGNSPVSHLIGIYLRLRRIVTGPATQRSGE